jgi:hypothetical protein
MTDNFLRLTRIFFALTSAAALGLYAYLASLMRPIGDDYCISARLIGYDPLFASLYKYWYTSNRFSNQFVAWFTDLFGPRGVAVFSVLCLLLWVVGLTWLLAEAARALRLAWNFWTGLLLAELIVLLSYYTSANLFQSVLWRPGVMTYLLPLVAYSFIFAGILRGSRVANGGRASFVTITVLFFLAFFTGGLSETAGALHISILGLALVVNFIWNKGATRRASLALLTAALTGALLAMIGMLITPANAIRLNGEEAPTIPVVLQRAFTFAVQFLREAARLLKIPAVFALGAGALIGYTYIAETRFLRETGFLKVGIALLLVPILTYLLIVASFAPSAYGQSYPLERVRFPAHALLAISLLLEGALIGVLATRIPLPKWTTSLALLALFIAALYPLWVTRNNLTLVHDYKVRAEQWDVRDAKIRDLAASGEKEIVVWQLPGIANVKDLDTRKGHWVNYCAAIYYGVETIAAPQGQIP